MRKPTLRQQVAALTEQFEPRVREAFLESIADVANLADLGRIIARLERGDIAGAIEAVHLDRAAFLTLDAAITQAYGAGGIAAINRLPKLSDPAGGNIVLRFDMRAPRVESYLAQHSANLVTGIVEDQRNLIRVALETGLRDGRNPRSTALDIVGRVSRVSNRRTGGLIGLTSQQSQAVENARQALRTGDIEGMRAYLRSTRRDKRFDSTVRAAIEAGRPVNADAVAKITGRYSDRLLQLRGETIARTETLKALHDSNHEAFAQGLEKTHYSETNVIKVWLHSGKKPPHARPDHVSMNGVEVRGLNTPFSLPDGVRMLHPHDTSLGAGAKDIVSCECDVFYKIDFLAGIE